MGSSLFWSFLALPHEFSLSPISELLGTLGLVIPGGELLPSSGSQLIFGDVILFMQGLLVYVLQVLSIGFLVL